MGIKHLQAGVTHSLANRQLSWQPDYANSDPLPALRAVRAVPLMKAALSSCWYCKILPILNTGGRETFMDSYNSVQQHLLPRPKHEKKNSWGVYPVPGASKTTLGDRHLLQDLPVPTFSWKPQVLCQAFRTSRPYLRMSGPPDGKHQYGLTQRPQSSQRICSPPVTSHSVVNDWDKIRWPEETSLTGQS